MSMTIGLRPNQYAFLTLLDREGEITEGRLRQIDQRITSAAFKRGFFNLTYKLSARITLSGRETLRQYRAGRNINRRDATAPLARILSTMSMEERQDKRQAKRRGKAARAKAA